MALDWTHLAVGLPALVGGLAVRGPFIIRAIRQSMDEWQRKSDETLMRQIEMLRINDSERQKADSVRMGGMVSLTNLVNDAMARVEGLAARAEGAELAAAKIIKDFNGLGRRLEAVEGRVTRIESLCVDCKKGDE